MGSKKFLENKKNVSYGIGPGKYKHKKVFRDNIGNKFGSQARTKIKIDLDNFPGPDKYNPKFNNEKKHKMKTS